MYLYLLYLVSSPPFVLSYSNWPSLDFLIHQNAIRYSSLLISHLSPLGCLLFHQLDSLVVSWMKLIRCNSYVAYYCSNMAQYLERISIPTFLVSFSLSQKTFCRFLKYSLFLNSRSLFSIIFLSHNISFLGFLIHHILNPWFVRLIT